MELWTALTLGFVGSLHCGVMCGPLVLAVPTHTAGRLIYNLGRLSIYGLMGGFAGLLGNAFAVAGVQRWVSLGAGIIVLLGWLLSTRFGLKTPAWRFVHFLKDTFKSLLQKCTLGSLFLLGAINGLLPCGLVYVAVAGAIASTHSVVFMLAFGLGTLPMMLGIGLASRKLRPLLGSRAQQLIPISIVTIGVLLVFRGLALGIPYLSPAANCCH